MPLTCVHLATLKIRSVSQTPPNFEQKTLPETVNNSRNEATSPEKIPFLFAQVGLPVWSMWLLTTTGQSGVTQQEKRAGSPGHGGLRKYCCVIPEISMVLLLFFMLCMTKAV